MKKTKVILLLFILFVTFQYSKVFSKINNSVIISVGDQPITQLDLIKEMKIISIITNNKIDDNNKEGIKNIAVQALIKRKIKEQTQLSYAFNYIYLFENKKGCQPL